MSVSLTFLGAFRVAGLSVVSDRNTVDEDIVGVSLISGVIVVDVVVMFVMVVVLVDSVSFVKPISLSDFVMDS